MFSSRLVVWLLFDSDGKTTWLLGPWNCLGQNLALAEISLKLAVLFKTGAPRLELFETDRTDTDHVEVCRKRGKHPV